MNDEYLLIQLRDCFTGSYTLPQFCIDNGIKKPLFVAEAKFVTFLWEIYVQFRYDKRMLAQFSLLDAPTGEIKFSDIGVVGTLKYENISEINLADFDAIICLTTQRIFSGNVIYLDMLRGYFIRKTYVEIPFLHFLQRHPKVKAFLTILPNNIYRYKGYEEFAKTIMNLEEITAQIKQNPEGKFTTPLDKFGYTNAQVLEIASTPDVRTNPDGTTVMEDTDDNSLQRIKNGKRVTAYQPTHFRNRIYFVGPCHYLGVYAPFDKTIESYLQQLLNENNLPYRVENEGQGYFFRYQDIFYNLNKLELAPGDIIFVWIDNLTANNLPAFNLSDAFDPPHDYKEIFVNVWHMNELGYKILAEKFFIFLTQNNFFRDVDFNYPTPPRVVIATAFRRSSRAA